MSKHSTRVHGTVQAFNVSPKGSYEGLLIQTKEGVVQCNFPQEAAQNLFKAAPVGTAVDAEISPSDPKGHPSHPVFLLLYLTVEGTLVFPASHRDGSEADEDNQFMGTAKRLNYALHGEVNGAILDSGDFLHLKPQGAAAVELKVGMTLKGRGSRKPMLGGHHVIEAEEVNGIKLEAKKPKPKKRAGHL